MTDNLEDLVKSFPTQPFLFVGSGMSRRYLGLPDWRGLLQTFSQRLSSDAFSFEAYLNEASNESDNENTMLARTAALLKRDFDKRWFVDPSFRRVDETYYEHIHERTSPFKVEIASYIHAMSSVEDAMSNEISLLTELLESNISGIITTNYDMFFEDIMPDYKAYVGQDELMFSSLQGWAEIYKIHGCITRPSSIVLTESDYDLFAEKAHYLAAKLMTLFIEYPIIFLGYSIADSNIQTILSSIVECCSSPDHLAILERRFIYVEWVSGLVEPIIGPYAMSFNGKALHVTRIQMDSFLPLYWAERAERPHAQRLAKAHYAKNVAA